MVRILIIGGGAGTVADAIGEHTGDQVAIDTARLPAAGIRQFESTPADAIIITDRRDGSRVDTLAEAIRERPLGRLVPVLVVAPPVDDVDDRRRQLDLIDWLPIDAPPTAIIDRLQTALDVTFGPSASTDSGASPRQSVSSAAAPDEQRPDGSASYFDGDVVLEPVDDAGPPPRTDGPRRQSSVFGSARRRNGSDDNPVTADDIDRKLHQVRHEDYYAILEVPRGAGTQMVREAFHRLYARFDPESVPFALVREHRREINEIRDALEDAFAVLGDPDLREAYLEHTVT